MVDNGLFPNGIGAHSTNAYVPVAMPWLDAVLDGERNWNLDITDLDWVDYYPIERMRAMSSPHSWGTPICWMANMDTNSPVKRDAAKRIQGMWVWMHDSWRNPYIPQLPDMPARRARLGHQQPGDAIYPLLAQPVTSSAQDKDILVSLWQLPDRVMLGVFNYNRTAGKDVALQNQPRPRSTSFPPVPGRSSSASATCGKPSNSAQNAQFDFNSKTLTIRGMQPHTLQLVGVRRY